MASTGMGFGRLTTGIPCARTNATSMKQEDAPESSRATEWMELELKKRHTSNVKLPDVPAMEPRECGVVFRMLGTLCSSGSVDLWAIAPRTKANEMIRGATV